MHNECAPYPPPHKIFCPVFAQSLVNRSRPMSVSGCEIIALITAGGAVTTSAPISAAWVMWLAVRIAAALRPLHRQLAQIDDVRPHHPPAPISAFITPASASKASVPP